MERKAPFAVHSYEILTYEILNLREAKADGDCNGIDIQAPFPRVTVLAYISPTPGWPKLQKYSIFHQKTLIGGEILQGCRNFTL
ncbi:hypothetical protein WDD9_005765 [Paenibacillus melissococcoides]|nr:MULTISPECIES: hypothetical protein [Paenibacillus]MEB9896157.1 hypothetical protein [Bacillus cereus]GIO81751.1 hypothetical protein J6TS7_53610 [Paenibacillus dendritiformis]CAH8719079.1 hypothetical protein HTL2_005491 [Paenibacillus melissococcoides]CAH8720088.1 hypothetical protein WDD9_005765 [Paenibacillus melissococcoides]